MAWPVSEADRDARLVLITAPLEAGWIERLQNISPELRIEWKPSGSTSNTVPDELWRDVEVLYTSFATRLPTQEKAPRLRWVQLYSAGADRIVETPLYRSPVVFTSASGVHAINIAEHVFGLTLAWFRHVPLILEWQRRQQWPSNKERTTLFLAEELWGKTLGIVGYGSIGRQVAVLARAFGMRVLAMQRGNDHRDRGFQFPGVGDPEGVFPERYYAPEQLHTMLRECDVVVIAVPLTPQTQGMFDASAFQAMKSTAFLVNIARGEVCDEAALIHALETNEIGGAALDVFQQEPLPPHHPLWRLPNVFITPHSAGLTPLYNERAAMIFEENLRRYLAGRPLYNVVDKSLAY
jgi:phosphoglycerate dehydrogenase-like enzyme